jgi:hypothetical protein
MVAEGRIERTTANLFSTDEGADVGMDEDTPVSVDYQPGEPSRFTGKTRQVTIEPKAAAVRLCPAGLASAKPPEAYGWTTMKFKFDEQGHVL